MVGPIFRLPFVGMIVKIVLFGVTAALVVVSVISYYSFSHLEGSLEQMRNTNADSRMALVDIENKVNSARTGADELLERERGLRDETNKLKEETAKLERDWEVVKMYKRRIEESGREIEEIRRRIRQLDR